MIIGYGTPTLARVLVSEEWESKSVTLLKELSKFKVFEESTKFSSKNDSAKNNKIDMRDIDKAKHDDKIDNDNINNDNDNEINTTNSLLQYYESKQNAPKCIEIRKKILQESIDLVQGSRRFGALRTFWSFGRKKLSERFMLPKMDLIYPTLIMPEKRFLLFPSISQKRYKIGEILSWNTEFDIGKKSDGIRVNCNNHNNNNNNIHDNNNHDNDADTDDDYQGNDDDDYCMFHAEKLNKKQRNYNLWLTFEHNRISECRRMFREEDIIGRRMKSYWRNVEYKITKLQPPDKTKKSFTIVNDYLPGTYEFIKISTPLFYHGSGTETSFFKFCE